MGFLAGQYVLLIPGLLLHIKFLLAFVKSAFWWALRRFEHQTSESSWHGENENSCTPACVELIRENLPVATFGEIVQRFCEVEEDFVCAVCLSAFEEEDEIRELCNCCHIFHKNCLDKWLDHCQNTCPLCRSCLLPEFVQRQDCCEGSSWIVEGISYVFAEDLRECLYRECI